MKLQQNRNIYVNTRSIESEASFIYYVVPVMRVIPPNTAAAPTIAYNPGVIQSSELSHSPLNIHKCGYRNASCCMAIPTTLPVILPRHKLGMKRPQGTFIPNVNIVVTNLNTRASVSNHIAWYTPGPASADVACLNDVMLFTYT